MLIHWQESGYPIVDVIYATTGSYAATCVLISFLVVLLFFSAVSTVASSSRQIWSFSRDHVSPPLSLFVPCTITDKSAGLPLLRMDPSGPPWLRSSRQLPHSLPRRLPYPGLHQLRQRRRPQRHLISEQRRIATILHHLNWRTPPTKDSRRTLTASPLVSRQVRRRHQRFDTLLLGRGVLLLVLAIVCAHW